ncbi:hypothetical protein SAY86_017014 [Trapa natans]|uniref:Methyltransferase n=2 Tax=Trapa TaxID=22665 RepID=A0AAN7R626_TRANT|nr:hypothetical protein SAY86_017014 [Trapa natans]
MRSPWFHKLALHFGPRPPLSWLLLCLISVLALITVLGSSSSRTFDSMTSNPEPDIYTKYRRLKEQAAVDYLDLRSLSSEPSKQKELSLCGKERENFVPCYNVSASLLAGYKEGEEFDRHCELSRAGERCLVRPPKDYKIPLMWPAGRDVIWSGNVKLTKDQFLSSGSMTKRMMLLEENKIAFHSDDGSIFGGVKDYSRQIAEMLGLGSDTEFLQAGVHTVLDIGCGFGSFGSHLLSLKIMALCIAEYEATGSQVQLALERGLPAMIGNFISKQLPYPSLSFDMVHCAQCGVIWDEKEGMLLLEVDRVLKPGGYFVLTSPSVKSEGSSGIHPEDFFEDLHLSKSALKNYWSLLTPLIFSDHPKRPGDEDPLPPFNMIRNVMDMNARYGGLNSAFLEEKKSVWVMNVIPIGTSNTLPLILDQGFAGVLHDWCEPFPTYPRTYDMLYANGILSHLSYNRCSMMDLLLEMDRILRPEGWIVLSDKVGSVEIARTFASQIHWEARVIDLQNGNDQRLLVCQKPFIRK